MQCNLDVYTTKEKPFLHPSSRETLTLSRSHQNNNGRSVPVAHPANAMQKNMATTQYVGELTVSYKQVQWQRGNKHPQQNSQGLYHQLESQASIASTGYRHPKPRDNKRRSRNKRHQRSRNTAHISAQYSSYCGTSANDNAVGRSGHHSGQQTDCFKRKKANTNIDTGLQQRQNLNCARSVGTSSAALQRDSHGCAAQMIPLQDRRSSVHQSKFEAFHPLLVGILKENTQDFKTAPPFSLEEIDANIEFSTSRLECGKTMTQTLNLSAKTDSTVPCQQQLSYPPLSSEPSREHLTDDQIQASIMKYVTDYRELKKMNTHAHTPNKGGSSRRNGRDSTLHSDDIVPKSNSVAHRPTTSFYKEDGEKQSLNHDVNGQRSATVGQALEEDSSKGTKANAELSPQSKVTGDCDTFASEKYSTATLASVGNSKHATKTTFFEKSKSVDFNLTAKRHQSSAGDRKLVYSGDCEDQIFLDGKWRDKFLLNGRTTHCSLTALKERITSLESRDTVAHMDNFPKITLQQYWNGDMDNNNLFISTESRCITGNDAATYTKKEAMSPVVLTSDMNLGQTEKHSSPTLRMKSVEDEQHCSATCKEGFVHSRPSSKLQIHNVESLTAKQWEQQSNKTSHEGAMEDVGSVYTQTDASFALSESKVREPALLCEDLKDSKYEDISDDEDVSQLATEVPNTEHEKFTFPEYEDISDDQNSQFENMAVVEDETDDEMDDDWIVIPINMSDIRFEPEEDDQDGPEEDALSDGGTGDEDTQCDISPAYCELPASASSPLEVFETVDSFKRAKGLQFINGFELASLSSTPEDGLEQEPHTPQTGDLNSEPEDSCDTEDSCDYSPGRERFYLSSQLLKKRSAHMPPETLDSESEKGNEDDEVTDVREGQTSFDKLGLQELKDSIDTKAASNHVQHKTNGRTISEAVDIIHIDSDTEDESDQSCSQKAKRMRLSSSGLDDRRDDSYCQRKSCSPETVDGQCGTVKDKDKTQGLQGPVIVLDSDSDTENDNDQSHQKANGMRLCSSGSDDCDDVQQESHSLETVDSKSGTAKEKCKDSKLPCGEPSFPQHQSKRHNTQSKEVMQDACNDSSHSLKKTGQRIGAEGSSAHAQHKTNRQTSEESKKKTKRTVSSGSEDSDNTSCPRKNRHSNETADRRHGSDDKKINKPRLLSQDSPKKQPRSVDKKADSALNPDPVIAHHVAQNSPPKDCLKVSRDSSVPVHGKDEKTRAPKTPTGSSIKTDSRETNAQPLQRNKKKVRFASVPASEDGRDPTARNKDAANREKPRLCSRQLSLPSQLTPSTSIKRSSFTSGQASRSVASSRSLSQSGETSTSPPKSNQGTSVPRQSSSSSSSRRISHSSSSCSTSDCPNAPKDGPSSSATVQSSSSRAQVLESWKNSYFPTRKDKRSDPGVGEDLRDANHNLCREARPRRRRRHSSHESAAVMKRQSSHESETRLMKKTKTDAVQWTWAINREAPRKERHSVGEGYKWSEKRTGSKPTKG